MKPMATSESNGNLVVFNVGRNPKGVVNHFGRSREWIF